LLIDTPIARLDKSHRENFINKFLSEVSNQVLLFVTDAELNEADEENYAPLTSHFYELEFQKQEGYTEVQGQGYTKQESKKALV
jgi:DNA sulfur modification protein DndD